MVNNVLCLNPDFSTTRLLKKGVSSNSLNLISHYASASRGGLMLRGYVKESSVDVPLISIITVTLNSEKYIEETMLSVLEQDYDNVEYIIIDGGSTDRTLDIISRYEDCIDLWVSEKDRNMYDAMNKGMKYATGEYLNFLNASDYYCNKNILSTLFRNRSNEDIVYGDIYVIDENNGNTFYQKAKNFSFVNLQHYATGTVNHQALFVKREIAPCYDPNFLLKAELNWYYDIIEHMKDCNSYKHFDLPVVYYRRGGIGDKIFWRQLFELITINYQRGRLLYLGSNIKTYTYAIIHHYRIKERLKLLLKKIFRFLRESFLRKK